MGLHEELVSEGIEGVDLVVLERCLRKAPSVDGGVSHGQLREFSSRRIQDVAELPTYLDPTVWLAIKIDDIDSFYPLLLLRVR